MKQVVEVIRERRSVADYVQRARIEWQTRALASFIAATTQDKNTKERIRTASELSMSPTGEAKQAAPTTDHLPGEAAHPRSTPPFEPRAGSHERLMAAFGGGPR